MTFMSDRELLEQVNSKLDALTPRVEALETAAAGAVSHDEVAAVADKETALEGRVSDLEAKFQPTQTTPPNPAPSDSGNGGGSDAGNGGDTSVDSTDAAPTEQHTVS